MNFDDTLQEAEFRAEVRAWIKANAPHHLRAQLEQMRGTRGMNVPAFNPVTEGKAWQKQKYDAGWACLQWPKEYGGRGASAIERVIWQQEEGPFAELSSMFGIGQGMCGPTVMAHGSEQARQSMLPKLASGEEVWCQLFSEPVAGSDLAGLRTRAERDGDFWVINGQKIWTSGAHYSDYGILITRTDPNVPKHNGLTMFYIDMKAPGVEVRPIKQISGQSHFNEVFFTDLRIPDSQRLGAVGNGWQVSLTTLMNERMSIGANVGTGFPELLKFCCEYETGDGLAVDDSAVRSKLATWAARDAGLKYTSYRSISAHSKGVNPGPENSIGKLVAGNMLQEIAMFAMDLQAQHGISNDAAVSEAGAHFQAMLFRAPAMRIAGGTDEILRNIIAERVLGLPADMRADRGIAFNKIPTKL
jgi:acyl-CoA dehydrogenase